MKTVGEYIIMSSLLHDKQEDDPKLKRKFKAATKAAEKECNSKKNQMGYCHAFWGAKKRILKDKYGIDWKPPAETNPRCKFD